MTPGFQRISADGGVGGEAVDAALPATVCFGDNNHVSDCRLCDCYRVRGCCVGPAITSYNRASGGCFGERDRIRGGCFGDAATAFDGSRLGGGCISGDGLLHGHNGEGHPGDDRVRQRADDTCDDRTGTADSAPTRSGRPR